MLGGSVVRGPKRPLDGQNQQFFCTFGRHIYFAFRDEANVIFFQLHEVLYGLSSETKMLDIE